MEDIVIVGSSGFAKEIKALIKRENKYNFIGFIDKKNDCPSVIGDDKFLLNYEKKLNVVIAIASPEIRRKLFESYKQNPNLFFPNVIDPRADFLEEVSMGIGNIICSGTVATVGVRMGDFNIINLNCTVGHEAVFDSFITLNPSVNISGDVYLKEGVFIGTGAQILQGLSIGKFSVIGAGAVAISDMPDGCTAVGVPAKIIKRVQN